MRPDSQWLRFGALAGVSYLLLVLEGVLALSPLRGVDLMPLLILFFALELEFMPGLAMAVGVGMAADTVSGLVPGVTLGALVAWYLVLRLAVTRAKKLAPSAVIIASGLSVAACLLLQGRLARLLGAAPAVDAASALVAAILVGWPLYAGLQRMDRALRPRQAMRYG